MKWAVKEGKRTGEMSCYGKRSCDWGGGRGGFMQVQNIYIYISNHVVCIGCVVFWSYGHTRLTLMG